MERQGAVTVTREREKGAVKIYERNRQRDMESVTVRKKENKRNRQRDRESETVRKKENKRKRQRDMESETVRKKENKRKRQRYRESETVCSVKRSPLLSFSIKD